MPLLAGVQYLELAPERAGEARLRICLRIGFIIPNGTDYGGYSWDVFGRGVLERIAAVPSVKRGVESSRMFADADSFREQCNRYLSQYGLEWKAEQDNDSNV